MYIDRIIYPVSATRSYTCTRSPPRIRVPTRLRTHPRARIGGPAVHNCQRRIDVPPSASAIVRAAGPGAAHTEDNVVTAAVFHAPMLALKADDDLNACAPKPHAVHADGHRLARLRVSGLGRARSTSPPTRAHTADPSPSHTGARMHNPDRFSRIQTNG